MGLGRKMANRAPVNIPNISADFKSSKYSTQSTLDFRLQTSLRASNRYLDVHMLFCFGCTEFFKIIFTSSVQHILTHFFLLVLVLVTSKPKNQTPSISNSDSPFPIEFVDPRTQFQILLISTSYQLAGSQLLARLLLLLPTTATTTTTIRY